jgi:hypothetical protein
MADAIVSIASCSFLSDADITDLKSKRHILFCVFQIANI